MTAGARTSAGRSYWQHRSPLEEGLMAEVSADRLMTHVRTMGAWERESGSPGEAKAYDYIDARLREAGLEVERSLIEAFISLPQLGRLTLADGSSIEGLAHAFSPSVEGLDAELVDAGDGTPEDYARVRAAGKLVLLQGLATPGRAWAAQNAGTLGQVFVNLDHLHNMIVTTVWGTPTPDTAWRIPKTPCLSIKKVDADRLRALLARGPLRLKLTTRVRTEWIPIPHLVARLDAGHEDRYVLFSGHVDAWHHGAMDNGTANATMLEVARLVASRRRSLRRGLRLAFWSGHSHGRYAGSAWYADHAWADLHRRCALHLYVDSVGARGATEYAVLHATEEAQGYAETVVHDVTGQRARGHRFSRAGDQSFWGIGVPSAFMSLSGIPRQDTELSRTMQRLFGTSGFPWWWHTREDTVDKIDADVLRLDTQVYVAAVLRTLDAPILPIEPGRTARSLEGLVSEIQTAVEGRADLRPAVTAAARLVERADALTAALDVLVASNAEAAQLETANRLLVRLSRVLVPLAYTTGDRFDHDLALPVPPLAGLQRVRELATLEPGSDAFRFAAAAAVRERNRVVQPLEEATELIDLFLNGKENKA